MENLGLKNRIEESERDLKAILEAIQENKAERKYIFSQSFNLGDFEEDCFTSREEIIEAEKSFYGEMFDSAF